MQRGEYIFVGARALFFFFLDCRFKRSRARSFFFSTDVQCRDHAR